MRLVRFESDGNCLIFQLFFMIDPAKMLTLAILTKQGVSGNTEQNVFLGRCVWFAGKPERVTANSEYGAMGLGGEGFN